MLNQKIRMKRYYFILESQKYFKSFRFFKDFFEVFELYFKNFDKN